MRKKVQAWIKERLTIPESYRDVDWSHVVVHENAEVYKYSIRHVYGFRHPDGAEYELDRIFMFDYAHEITGFEEIYPHKYLYRSFHRP